MTAKKNDGTDGVQFNSQLPTGSSITIHGCSKLDTREERVTAMRVALTALSQLAYSMQDQDDFVRMIYDVQSPGRQPVRYQITIGQSEPLVRLLEPIQESTPENEARAVYRRVAHHDVDLDLDRPGARFTVRQWDGMDGCWCDVEEAKCVSVDAALDAWMRCTKNGTKGVSFSEIDYCAIFPADTRMVWDGGPGREMFRDPIDPIDPVTGQPGPPKER
jgi:hypothetical protein